MLRIPIEHVQQTLSAILRSLSFRDERAEACSRLFVETTCDGVYTHGVHRFSRFVAMVRNGSIDVNAEPVAVARFGALERWDGRQGPGNLNAHAAMERAIALSRLHGVGCVAMSNTNHWMRGGTYGWQAAEAGCIAICWTNTMPNLPPWGAKDPCIGNNPLVIAAPRPGGALVLDMAMSQFSYGALESFRLRGEMLPLDGGFDAQGNLTRDPAAVEASGRPLPVGYWKGSGLAILLDAVAAMLSLGNATCQVAPDPLKETSVSQVFIAIDPATLGTAPGNVLDEIVRSLHQCAIARNGTPVRYPGERTLATREENQRLGLPVDEAVWADILRLSTPGTES